MSIDFESRLRDLKARAHGHWTGLLAALGVDEHILVSAAANLSNFGRFENVVGGVGTRFD